MPDIDQPQTEPQPQERSAYPSPFGRGWIPEERDIGLPGEPRRAGGGGGAPQPDEEGRIWLRSPEDVAAFLKEWDLDGEEAGVPLARVGAAGSAVPEGGEGPTPNPSRMREGSHEGGLSRMREGEEDVAVVRADQFTPARRVRFLDALANVGSVRAACEEVEVSAECVYRLRRRDAGFARGWAAALVLAREAAGEELADRALNGVKEAIFHQGKMVGMRRRLDARLLLAHVARLDRMADDHAASADAARFDELLSVIGGERADSALYIPGFCEGDDEEHGPDPLLPCSRETYLEVREYRADTAWTNGSRASARNADVTPAKGPPADEAAGDPDAPAPAPDLPTSPAEALALAKAEWDSWYAEACAAVDALVDKDADRAADGYGDGDGEPPMEFKSLDAAGILPVDGEGDRDAQRRGGGGCRPGAAVLRSCPAVRLSALRHPERPLRQALRACHLPAGGEDREVPGTVSTVSTYPTSVTFTPFQNAMRSRMDAAFSLGSG